MSPGFRRAVAGQGAAAAVQFLVTLSFLPSLVKTQVSRRGGGRAAPASPRDRGGGTSGRSGTERTAPVSAGNVYKGRLARGRDTRSGGRRKRKMVTASKR